MSLKLLQTWVDAESPTSSEELLSIVREIGQHVILQALSEHGLFKVASFQGGTCLRILHGLPRYSEDIDILAPSTASIDFDAVIAAIGKHSSAFGFRYRPAFRDKRIACVRLRDRNVLSAIKTPFRKIFDARPELRDINIKIEVNQDPPSYGTDQVVQVDQFVPYHVRALDPSTLFAGKMHALLCRNKVKGRDWFDFAWYRHRVNVPNMSFLQSALARSGALPESTKLTANHLKKMLHEKIAGLNMDALRADVAPFLMGGSQAVEGWSETYFRDITNAFFQDDPEPER